MKQYLKISIGMILLLVSSCDVINETINSVNLPNNDNTENGENPLTEVEVIDGLKEALNIGIKNAVDITSVTDGFLGNSEIKIPFPESAIKMKEWAENKPILSDKVVQITETLNRAAEDAAKEATPIFVNAIKNMSISNGFDILKGGDGAATKFLKDSTTNELVAAFSPKVQASIEKVKLTDYWEPVMTKYNQAMIFTGGDKIETDLNKYVTERAISGLFKMVEKEENKIRKDAGAQVTDILQRVFGSLLK